MAELAEHLPSDSRSDSSEAEGSSDGLLRIVPVPKTVADPQRTSEFAMPEIHRKQWELMSAVELLTIRALLSERQGALAFHIHELQMTYDEGLRALIEINGWIKDRNSPPN